MSKFFESFGKRAMGFGPSTQVWPKIAYVDGKFTIQTDKPLTPVK